MGELASERAWALNQGAALSSVDWRPAEGWHGFVCPDFSAMFWGGDCLWEAYDKGGFAFFLSVCCRLLLSAAWIFSLFLLSQAPSLALRLFTTLSF